MCAPVIPFFFSKEDKLETAPPPSAPRRSPRPGKGVIEVDDVGWASTGRNWKLKRRAS